MNLYVFKIKNKQTNKQTEFNSFFFLIPFLYGGVTPVEHTSVQQVATNRQRTEQNKETP